MIDPGDAGECKTGKAFSRQNVRWQPHLFILCKDSIFFFFVKKKALYRLPFWSLLSFLIDYLPLR